MALSSSFNNVLYSYRRPNAAYPAIDITGITAPFGDPANLGTHLRTFEWRDTFSVNAGSHLLRTGAEVRKLFMGMNLGQSSPVAFYFTGLNTFATDTPYEQTLTATPSTGQPAQTERDFTVYETGVFAQDDWKVNHRLTLTGGLRNDYFGDPSEPRDLVSSITFGQGSTFNEQLANATVGPVSHLFHAPRLNLSPRVGLAYDPVGDGKSTIRAGFSLAYEPIRGRTVLGGTSNPPYAISGVIWPANGYGTTIDYAIPVPFNPQFKTTLNAQGGVVSPTGEPPIRISPWLINPNLKTQYSESWFLNTQREIARGWIVELGYVGTNGVHLERRGDINRFDGDELKNNLQAERINQNMAAITYVLDSAMFSHSLMRHSPSWKC